MSLIYIGGLVWNHIQFGFKWIGTHNRNSNHSGWPKESSRLIRSSTSQGLTSLRGLDSGTTSAVFHNVDGLFRCLKTGSAGRGSFGKKYGKMAKKRLWKQMLVNIQWQCESFIMISKYSQWFICTGDAVWPAKRCATMLSDWTAGSWWDSANANGSGVQRLPPDSLMGDWRGFWISAWSRSFITSCLAQSMHMLQNK